MYSLFSTIAFIIFFSIIGFAQVDTGDPASDPDVPIDGGISLLIAAGAGYGVKKIRDHRKNRDA
jgi:choline-glycine betaine transporter